MIKRCLWMTMMVCLGFSLAVAQHGSAPDGYYPLGYGRDIFTGLVTATDDSTQSITIEYSKGKKHETFAGRFDKPCSIPTKDSNPMKASDIPSGTDLTAYYNHKTKKVGGQKEDDNVIIAVMFNSFNGSSIPKESRKLYYCITGQTKFQAH